jgi:hypothetical protein
VKKRQKGKNRENREKQDSQKRCLFIRETTSSDKKFLT